MAPDETPIPDENETERSIPAYSHFRMELARLLGADSVLTHAFLANAEFSAMVWKACEKADVLDEITDLKERMPAFVKSVGDVWEAGLMMQRYAKDICRILEHGSPPQKWIM